MARKREANSKKADDWKSKFVNVGLSYNDEKEIKEYISTKGVSSLSDLLETILDNGGSVKFTHSANDGSIFCTVSTDKQHTDYGSYLFGFRYPTLAGALAILDWFYHTRLQTDVGLQYLPDTLEDWLNLG